MMNSSPSLNPLFNEAVILLEFFLIGLAAYGIFLIVVAMLYRDFLEYEGKGNTALLILQGGIIGFLVTVITILVLKAIIDFWYTLLAFTILLLVFLSFLYYSIRKSGCSEVLDETSIEGVKTILCDEIGNSPWFDPFIKTIYLPFNVYSYLSSKETISLLIHEYGHYKHYYYALVSRILYILWSVFMLAVVSMIIFMPYLEALLLLITLLPLNMIAGLGLTIYSWIYEHLADETVVEAGPGLYYTFSTGLVKLDIHRDPVLYLIGAENKIPIPDPDTYFELEKPTLTIIMAELFRSSLWFPKTIIDTIIKGPKYNTHPPVNFRFYHLENYIEKKIMREGSREPPGSHELPSQPNNPNNSRK